MNKPLCFVLMPFGKKTDAVGNTVDFDRVYYEIIAPAIKQAGLETIRADEEMTGGIIHKPMFERLILCEYAVADLTTANANVFYELGLRHAVRPWSTVLIFADGGRLPFDVALLRALPYRLSSDGVPAAASTDSEVLAKRLIAAVAAATDNEKSATDSPLYQLVEDYPNVAHEKTDVFREQVRYSEAAKKRLEAARKQGVDALRAIEKDLGDLKMVEAAVLIDLFLSYRAVKGWTDMIALVDKMPRPLAATVMVQEQLGLALNRAGRGEEAEQTLTDLVTARGASSETLGILGRVYKDRWQEAVKNNEKLLSRSLLDKAIETYLRGFEADWRDAYPGINAVTLMELKEPPDLRREKILPVVTYAVEQKIAKGKPDYWDYATLLELAVMAKDEQRAMQAAGDALSAIRESWEPETTLRNLRLIREARERRNENVGWAKDIEDALEKKAKT
jgi:tetratricopeptide (TPR) repeat protein